jgi:putative tryptophan/tyrosine transport system substrate-binding protein
MKKLLLNKFPGAAGIIFLFLIIFCFPQFCIAQKIALITRKNVVPYDAFLDGYKYACERSHNKGCKLKVFYLNLQNASEENLVKDVLSYEPDLLVSIGSGALSFSASFFPDIPQIYSMVLNPYSVLKNKKINGIGVSMQVDIKSKLKILKQIMKDIKRIGTVYNPIESSSQIHEAEIAAKEMGLEFYPVPISSSSMAIKANHDVIDRVDAYILFFDRTVLTPAIIEHLFKISFRKKVPVIGVSPKYVKLGSLFSVDCETREIGHEAWRYTKLYLANPGNYHGLKVPECSQKITINSKIADKMNISIPDKILEKCKNVL